MAPKRLQVQTTDPEPRPARPERREPPPLPRRSLRPSEACHVLGIGRTKLYDLIGSGALPVVRVGKVTLIPVAGIDRLLGTAAE